MNSANRHVIPRARGGWAVWKTGASRVSRIFEKRREAVDYAKRLAKETGGVMYLHNGDGTVRDRFTFGNDPMKDTGSLAPRA